MDTNKLIEKLEAETYSGGQDDYGIGYNDAIDDAIAIIRQADEQAGEVITTGNE